MKRTASHSIILLLLATQIAFAAGKAKKQPSHYLKEIQEGDIIFLQSQSPQAPALEAATGSPWTHVGVIMKGVEDWVVYEASARVTETPLQTFIQRGKNHHFVVTRVRDNLLEFTPERREQLRTALNQAKGLRYDVFFEWSDNLIYCSELVWKAYFQAFDLRLTVPQKMKELNLTSPVVKELIVQRYIKNGKKLNLNEPIVTPVSLLNSKSLEPVLDAMF